MKKSSRYIIGLITIFMFLISVMGAVSTSVFELSFYQKAQRKYAVAEKMSLSETDVTEATIVALLYTKGHTNDLTYLVDTQDIYSSQDKEHMIDVQNLYRGMYYTLVLTTIFLFVAVIFLFFDRKQINTYSLTLIINKVSLYSLGFVAIIGLFAFINFSQFWVIFHKVFFRNDLWLMNPAQDALVNLFPEGLFMDLVYRILFKFIVIFGGLNLVAYLYRFFSVRRSIND